MGKKKKIILIPPEIVQKIHEDIGGNRVKIYQLDDLPEQFVDKDLIHPNVYCQCDTFVAAVSGSYEENREYMFIAGLRRDCEGDNQVTDIDPIGMVYDLSTQSPDPSGIAVFHGNFEGGTDEANYSTAISVKELKEKLNNNVMSFEEAPKRFQNAMHFVARKYKDNVDKP